MGFAEQRFGGVARLYGKQAAVRLAEAHVCVIGIGGVGSWAAEALGRSGIGRLTLVDLDEICVTNVNRQLHALQNTIGQPKVDVMASRLKGINPEVRVVVKQEFFTAETAETLLKPDFDFVVDAIDASRLKALLLACCASRSIPAVTSGGAGGRRNPTRLRVADLAESAHDPLLAQVRRDLRRNHGFPPQGKAMGIEAVFSTEPAVYPSSQGDICAEPERGSDRRIDCRTGMGTACFVTGAFGFALASRVVSKLAEATEGPPHSHPNNSR